MNQSSDYKNRTWKCTGTENLYIAEDNRNQIAQNLWIVKIAFIKFKKWKP